MMAEDELNEAPKDAEQTAESAPVKKRAARKKVPAKASTVKKKVVAKKKAAPKKKAARKRSIAPKQAITPSEPPVAPTDVEVMPEQAVEARQDSPSPANQGVKTNQEQTESSVDVVVSTTLDKNNEVVSASPAEEESDAIVGAAAVPPKNENVQKRLEEMGLMPSDSAEKQTPPPKKTGSKGLGFWQKSFILIILIVAGLLYIRNVANNGDLAAPEMALTDQSETRDADVNTATVEKAPELAPVPTTMAKQELPITEKAPAVSVPATETAEVTAVPAQTEAKISDSVDPQADQAESPQQKPVPAIASETADSVKEPAPSDQKATNVTATNQVMEKLEVIAEEPGKIMNRLTAFIRGSDSSTKDAALKEEGAKQSQETANESAVTSTETPAEEQKATVASVAEATATTDTMIEATSEPAAVTIATTTSEIKKSEPVIQNKDEASQPESVASTTTESEQTTAEEKTESSTTTATPFSYSAMPRDMSRMMQGYGSRLNPYARPNSSNAPAGERAQVQRTAPNRNQFGYQRYPNQAPQYPRYSGGPIYPRQYNAPVVPPYYSPYPVRPPVYGPVVRYPYLQAPPVAPPVR